MIDVSVILPAFNEEQAIGDDLDRIKEAMESSPYTFEIIVVDDASTDRTAEIAAGKGVTVISHRRNKGSGGSRKTGIRAARGRFIAMCDADGSYPIGDIPTLVGYLPEYDLVVGARKEEKGTHKVMRSLAKFIIRKLAEFLTGREIPDLNTGLMAFKRELITNYLYLIPNGFSCTSTISLIHLTNGYDVKYVPIDYYKRIGKSKFHPFKDTSKYLLTVIRITSHFNPLKVFITVSGIVLGAAVIKSLLDIALLGTLEESDVILFLAAIIIGALGIIADLIVTQGRRD